jgi:uncharacterized RDD family membrane protein YckC
MASGLSAAPAGEAPTGAARVQDLRYVGLATRVVSFVVDAAVITFVDIGIGLGAALILAVLHIPHELRTILAVIGAAAFVLGSILYFVIFWTTTGQTPGARVMQIRVVSVDGAHVKPRWSVVRCVGVLLAALPLFAGFVPILVTSRRRGFQDWLARTVVVEAPGLSIAEVSRAKQRAIREASRQPPPAVPK